MHEYLERFASKYEKAGRSEQISEEQLAELFGALSSQYNVMTAPQKNVIQKFIDKVAKFFGYGEDTSSFTNDDIAVVDLLNSLSNKLRTGEELK